MTKFKDLVRLIRPKHWLKNFLVFAPIFFAGEIFLDDKLDKSLMAFAVFCLAASGVYIVNDIFDKEKDQSHPFKKFRPLASGSIKISLAVFLAIILFTASLILSFFFVKGILLVILLYVILNFFYSTFLKHWPIFDFLAVAVFYLLRVLAGGLASETFMSGWLILCVLFVSLFLVVGKRIKEMKNLDRRKVLDDYNDVFLNQVLTSTATLSIISYGVYTVLGLDSPYAVYSNLFVVLGIFRYLFLISSSGETEFPENLIFTDKVVLTSVLGWILFMYFIFY